MSVTPGTDSLLDPLTISFDTALPVLADCQIYTVAYSVTFKDYPSNVAHSGDFIFTLADPCGEAIIIAQTITFPTQTFEDYTLASTFMVIPAFMDSVDASGTYPLGYCGEKTVILDADAPSFLSITQYATDPSRNNFMITFDSAAVTEADIGVYSVGYTVSFEENAL